MSEISVFAVALLLPIAAAACLVKLFASLGHQGLLAPKKYHWPTTLERHELLTSTYQKELAKLEETGLSLSENDSLRTISNQHNHLRAMFNSLESLDVMSLVAKEKHSNLFSQVQSNLTSIQEACNSETPGQDAFKIVSDTDSMLRDLTLKANSALANIEREVTSDLVTESLQSMGYRLIAKDNSLLGSCGDTSILAKVSGPVNISLDTRSFDGLSCQKEVARFENTLRAKGIVPKRLLDHHAKRSGGVLLRDPFPSLRSVQQNANKNQGVPQEKSGDQHQHLHLIREGILKHNQMLKET